MASLFVYLGITTLVIELTIVFVGVGLHAYDALHPTE